MKKPWVPIPLRKSELEAARNIIKGLYFAAHDSLRSDRPGWNQNYPAIQILTIADLLDKSKNAGVKMPPAHGTFKEAQKVKQEDEATQMSMLAFIDLRIEN